MTTMNLCILCLYKALIILHLIDMVKSGECQQGRSRVVRGVLQYHLKQLYKTEMIDVPRSCPFHSNRDIFKDHESHKTEEGYGKWCCEYCGKMFYAELYLDKHLQNRHGQYLYMAPDAVCLAEYCDIFRCDVISRREEPSFWDTALCIEDDMSDMVAKCHGAFQNCFPSDKTSLTYAVMNKTKNTVCSSLTCNRYWYTGKVEESQWIMLLKTFCTVFLIGTLIIYYFLAYQHFYSESLFYERPSPPPMKPYNASNIPHRKHRRRRVPPI